MWNVRIGQFNFNPRGIKVVPKHTQKKQGSHLYKKILIAKTR